MKRRQAIAYTAALTGGTLASTHFLLLDEMGETMLPATPSSPGAKAVQIKAFMVMRVTDCYDEKEQSTFTVGLKEVEKRSKAQFSKGFLKLSPEQRFDLLNSFDLEAPKVKKGDTKHFFSMIKDLTQMSYFSSEPGVTQALRYNPILVRFDGCVAYNGEKAWY